MASYLNNGDDVMNCFDKFEKFLAQSIIMPSFMTVGSQMLVRPEALSPTYKLGSQNTPCSLELNTKIKILRSHFTLSEDAWSNLPPDFTYHPV